MLSLEKSKQACSLLLGAAVVFAPAPPYREVGRQETPEESKSIAAQILSPAFNEGLVREGSRSLISRQRNRKSPLPLGVPLPTAVLLVSLLLAATEFLSRTSCYVSRLVPSVLGSRAPPGWFCPAS